MAIGIAVRVFASFAWSLLFLCEEAFLVDVYDDWLMPTGIQAIDERQFGKSWSARNASVSLFAQFGGSYQCLPGVDPNTHVELPPESLPPTEIPPARDCCLQLGVSATDEYRMRSCIYDIALTADSRTCTGNATIDDEWKPNRCENLNHCNLNGYCRNGTCVCADLFTGPTCATCTFSISFIRLSLRRLRSDQSIRIQFISFLLVFSSLMLHPFSLGTCPYANADCINGICTCQPGWAGADCSTNTRVQIPCPVSATFTASGSVIEVPVSALCEQASQAQNPSCAAILNATSLATLGTSPTCRWASNRFILEIVPGFDATILPGQTLDFQADVFWDTTHQAACGGRSILVSGPSQPPIPEPPVIIGPTEVGSCADLTLDATVTTGLAGRAGYFTWFLNDSTSTNSSHVAWVQARLASVSGLSATRVQFSASELEPGTSYQFAATVRNYFSLTSQPGFKWVKKSQWPLPSLVISAPAGCIYRTQGIDLRVIANAPVDICTPPQTSYSFTWALEWHTASVAPVLDVSSRSPSLNIPASVLQAGARYSFLVTVSFSGNLPSTSSRYVLCVIHTPLICLMNGQGRLVSATASLTLDSPSLDVDSSSTQLSYSWSCLLESGQSCFAASASWGQTLRTISVPASLLTPSTKYSFTVQVTDAVTNRSCSTTGLIETLPPQRVVPEVRVSTQDGGSIFNPGDTIRLTGSVIIVGGSCNTLVYKWTQLSGPALNFRQTLLAC